MVAALDDDTHEREQRERVKRAQLQAGALSDGLDGLRERMQGSSGR